MDPPVITARPIVRTTLEDRAVIEWSTDELCDSAVDYGPTDAFGEQAYSMEGSLTHIVQLTNLESGTEYNSYI